MQASTGRPGGGSGEEVVLVFLPSLPVGDARGEQGLDGLLVGDFGEGLGRPHDIRDLEGDRRSSSPWLAPIRSRTVGDTTENRWRTVLTPIHYNETQMPPQVAGFIGDAESPGGARRHPLR